MTTHGRLSCFSQLRRLAGVTAGVVLAGTAAGDTVEQRFAALEQRLATIESENKSLRRQLGAAESTFVTAAGKETSLAVGGFIHANFESGDAPDARYNGINDRFLIRRARLNATAVYKEHVGFKFEADFGNNSIAPKAGASGQITDVFATWTRHSFANVRLGQFKTPFGYEQLVSDTKTLTVERGLSNDRLTLGRQIGAMVLGDVVGKRVNYSVGAFNGAGTNNGGNDSSKFLWVGRVGATAWQGEVGETKVKLFTAANAFTTEDKGTFTGRRNGLGFDAQLVAGPAEFHAEWLRNDYHPAVGLPTAARGWALLGAISITRQVQGVVRYEEFDSHTSAPRTTTTLWTFGFNYRLKGDDLKLTFDYVLGDQPATTADGGRFMSRVQVVF